MALLARLLWRTLLCVWLGAGAAWADDALQLQEQEIKAGLLYNFLKYTEWPAPGGTGKITVCLFDGDPFTSYLQPMAGRTVSQREIALRTLHGAGEAEHCQMLFMSASAAERWTELHTALAGKHVLTVSDSPDFASEGGMIEFGRKENHISVSLNTDAVASAGLHVQDRLLKLVTVVHGGSG